MSHTAFFTQIAETLLLAAGGAAIAGVAVMLTIRRRWAEAVRLPPTADHGLEPIDLLIGVGALLLLPGLFLGIFDIVTGAMPTTQPAAGSLPAPQSVVANCAGQVAAAVVILLLGRSRFAGGLAGWGLRAAEWPRQLVTAVAVYIAIWPLCAGVLDLTVRAVHMAKPGYVLPEHNALRLLEAANVSWWVYGLTIVSALIFAPIVEEFFFRGLLQPAFAKWSGSPWKGVVLSGCAFGLFHYSYWHTVPALALFGIALGFAYAKTRSLALVMLIHAVFNGKTLLWLMLSR
jgi:membrane protease YdiL (CAAX protease family)